MTDELFFLSPLGEESKVDGGWGFPKNRETIGTYGGT